LQPGAHRIAAMALSRRDFVAISARFRREFAGIS
jgi:hypothetical protein